FKRTEIFVRRLNCSPLLRKIIRRALTEEAQYRYESVVALCNAIRNAIQPYSARSTHHRSMLLLGIGVVTTAAVGLVFILKISQYVKSPFSSKHGDTQNEAIVLRTSIKSIARTDLSMDGATIPTRQEAVPVTSLAQSLERNPEKIPQQNLTSKQYI